ncbi:MAG: hypothetical protein SF029_10190 [bacterium]|nr:hypothetical protein [bacterium]
MKKAMFLTAVISLLSILTFSSAVAQEALYDNCVLYSEAVAGSFDPNNPPSNSAATQDWGCYQTLSEAIYVATGGTISLPTDASFAEVDAALKMEEHLPESETSSFSTLQAPKVYAVVWDWVNYNNSGGYLVHSGNNACDAGYYYSVYNYQSYSRPYVFNPNWDDDISSFATYEGCNKMYTYEYINFAGSWSSFGSSSPNMINVYGVNWSDRTSSAGFTP